MVDLSLKHEFHSVRPASNDATKIDGPKWNEEHVLLLAVPGVLGSTTVGEAGVLTKTEVETWLGLPSASNDNAVARFDGVTGTLQNSGVIVDDSNNVLVPGSLTVGSGELQAGAPSGLMGTIAVGSTASPSTSAHSTLLVSKAVNLSGGPELIWNCAVAGVIADQVGTAQPTGLIGVAYQNGAGDCCGVGGAGYSSVVGKAAFGGNFSATQTSSLGFAIACEYETFNGSGVAAPYDPNYHSGLTHNYMTGLDVYYDGTNNATATAANGSVAILIRTGNFGTNDQGAWDVGIGFFAGPHVKTADIQTNTNSANILLGYGTHTNGIYLNGVTFSGGYAFSSTGFGVSGADGTVFAPRTVAAIMQGGGAAGSSLTLKSTEAVGTTDYIRAVVGNNGATEAWRVLTSGDLVLGSTEAPATTWGNYFGLSSASSTGYNISVSQAAGGTPMWYLNRQSAAGTVFAFRQGAADIGSIDVSSTQVSLLSTSGKTISLNTATLTTAGALTLPAALTYGGVTLANSVTGTGKMVLDTAPTLSKITFSTTAGVVGTITNDSADSGSVGEILTATTGSTNYTPSGSDQNATSLSLTAGDWDVWGYISVELAATTNCNNYNVGISTTSATMPGYPNYMIFSGVNIVGPATNMFAAPPTRVSLSGTTIVYLIVNLSFSTSTVGVRGNLFARRRR